MKERRYRLIVFDWDGTLMDSAAKIVNCFRAAARDAGVTEPTPRAVRGIIGLGMPEALGTLFPDADGDTIERLGRAYRDHFLEHDRTYTGLFPGVLEGLNVLKSERFLLGVATGKARRGLNRVMEETGTRDLFDSTRCVDEAESKPAPRMLLDILDNTGMAAHECLMVGDTTFDLRMAASAGLDALAVGYGAHPAASLLREGPRACLDDFNEVVQWIREN